jgi:IS30 family transposase
MHVLQNYFKEFFVMAKKTHLTDADRLQIEILLKHHYPLNRIAEQVGKAKSTVAREIKKRAQESEKFAAHFPHNRCIKRKNCGRVQLCGDKPNCTRRCALCNRCNHACEIYEEETCLKLYEPPYVCNGCATESRCVLKKRYYLHKQAHEAYREMLVESRQGANITGEELLELDNFVSPLIKRGQSVSHIFTNNPNNFNVSEKSVYRYVAGGLLDAGNLDMPRVVRFKPRKAKPVEHKVDSGCRIGRNFLDYGKFIEVSGVQVVEMDTVKGGVSGKVLLTLMFKSCDFMLAFLRERNTSQTVIDCFSRLYALLGADAFKTLFPVILTDNGSEFSNPRALEFDEADNRRTHIFYCDPHASWQKPNVELNHEFIRKILPKGMPFNNLKQEDIDLMMSHINSYSREKLNNKSPIKMFDFLYGEGLAEKLGQTKIPPNEILLKPSLLKKKTSSLNN